MALRVVIVGSGYVAPFHLRGWSALADAQVVGIVSIDHEQAAALARAYDIDHVHADLPSALDELAPDAVDICTPAEVHGLHIRQAAAAGAHILCQKPLAPSLEEAIAATEAAEASGARLMVHENFRFRPWHRVAKRVLDSGTVGAPIYFRSDHRMAGTVTSAAHPERPWSLARQPYFADIEPFLLLESAIHQIDVACFFLGQPSSIYARARRISPHVKGEDMVSMMIGFGPTTAVVERSYASRGYEPPPVSSESMTIEAAEGLIHLDTAGCLRVVKDRPGGRREWAPEVERGDAYADSFAATIAHFAHCLADDKPFETGPSENLRVLDAVFAAYRSIDSGAAVALPSPRLATFLAGDDRAVT